MRRWRMTYKSAYVHTIHALGILMILQSLLMLNTLISLVGVEGFKAYSVACICMFFYGIFGLYILFNRKKSIVTCITLVLVVHAITVGLDNVSALYSTDDIEFAKAIVNIIIAFLDLVLLVLYLIGFRRSSRRLMVLLAIQAYVMFLELIFAIHASREFFNTVLLNFPAAFNMVVYLMLIFLLCNRSVSDLPIKRTSRYNGERLYTSMCCGSIITISDEDYAMLSSQKRSGWNYSLDPDVEVEISIPARDRYGKYGIIVQKRHGSDKIRMVFHDATSIGYLNTVTIDVLNIVEMETEYDCCRKVRFYGKEGMFIDLLVGDFEAVERASQSF